MRLKHSKLTHNQTNKLLEHFVAGTPARTACLLVGVNKDTAAIFYHRLWIVIAEKLNEETSELGGEVEVVESYFDSCYFYAKLINIRRNLLRDKLHNLINHLHTAH